MSQNAPRICRALFEIALRRSWSSLAEQLLTFSKVLQDSSSCFQGWCSCWLLCFTTENALCMGQCACVYLAGQQIVYLLALHCTNLNVLVSQSSVRKYLGTNTQAQKSWSSHIWHLRLQTFEAVPQYASKEMPFLRILDVRMVHIACLTRAKFWDTHLRVRSRTVIREEVVETPTCAPTIREYHCSWSFEQAWGQESFSWEVERYGRSRNWSIATSASRRTYCEKLSRLHASPGIGSSLAAHHKVKTNPLLQKCLIHARRFDVL